MTKYTTKPLYNDKLNREGLISNGPVKKFIETAKAVGIKVRTDQERESLRKSVLSELLPEEDLWIFAYGSLMWNPTIEFVEEDVGETIGWRRDFCIYSPIGRGCVEAPGLMMGLDIGGHCKGKIYRIAAEHKEHESTLLWRRESTTDTYIPQWIEVDTAQGKIKALAFIVDRQNSRYRNRHCYSLEEKAKMIAVASGLLGSNKEYLFNTVEALRQLKIYDGELELLAEKVRQIEANQ